MLNITAHKIELTTRRTPHYTCLNIKHFNADLPQHDATLCVRSPRPTMTHFLAERNAAAKLQEHSSNPSNTVVDQ